MRISRQNFRKRQSGFTLIELMIVIAIIAILASILTPSYIRARAMTQLTACKSNLKNMATALEAYSVDHSGHYPTALTTIAPEYMKVLPTCPATATDTYTASYSFTSNPDTFDMFCSGTSHQNLSTPPDYPRYNSGSGLSER